MDIDRIPVRPAAFGPYEGVAEPHGEGGWLIRSTDPLRCYPRRCTESLMRWAAERPTQAFVVERDAAGHWRTLDYASAWQQVQSLGQALIDRGASAERPLMVLSGNGIEHALLMLAALHVGAAVAPISPAYSLLDPDAAKVRHAVALLTPGLVFAADAGSFGRAIAAAIPHDIEVVLLRGSLGTRGHTRFEQLLSTPAGPAVAQAHAAVDGDTVAKFLFTSGSTRLPKAVINTHRMLCCNQQMFRQCYPFVEEEAPVLVDWMPWHHTAAGNINFGVVLTNGGTLYLDDGKPTEAGMPASLRNLRELAPTMYFTVPKGLELLTRAMRQDAPLRRSFFSRLRLVFPAGAALPAPVLAAFDELAVQTVGTRIALTAGLGMTETAPSAISAHLPHWQPGMIGLPVAGVAVKLVPVSDKLEVRYRGPSVTPGYWRQPELTRAAFDDEGFFRSGDAACFIDPRRPQDGLLFDGRIAEDFKLSSGTWVNVAALRAQVLLHGAPHVQDVVITGHDRDEVGMLVFLWPSAALLSASLAPDAPMADIARDAGVQSWMLKLMQALAADATGSSQRITRASLQAEPPSAAHGEVTDKGSINQGLCLSRRSDAVAVLHAAQIAPHVVRLAELAEPSAHASTPRRH